MSSPSGVPPPLPQGWEQRFTETGQPYYVDHATQTTHWQLPNAPTAQPSPQPQQPSYNPYAPGPSPSPSPSPSEQVPGAAAPGPVVTPPPGYPATPPNGGERPEATSYDWAAHGSAPAYDPTMYFSNYNSDVVNEEYARAGVLFPEYTVMHPADDRVIAQFEATPREQYILKHDDMSIGTQLGRGISNAVGMTITSCLIWAALIGLVIVLIARSSADCRLRSCSHSTWIILFSILGGMVYIVYLIYFCYWSGCCKATSAGDGTWLALVEESNSRGSNTYDTFRNTMQAMTGAVPTLIITVECWHYERKRRVSQTMQGGRYIYRTHTETRRVTSYRGAKPIRIRAWKDISAEPSEAVSKIQQVGSMAVDYQLAYELGPECLAKLEKKKEKYYEKYRNYDTHCKTNVIYNIHGEIKKSQMLSQSGCSTLCFNPGTMFLCMLITCAVPYNMLYKAYHKPAKYNNKKLLRLTKF